MFSGKSSELIRRINRHTVIGQSVLVINSSHDTRSSENVVRTHDLKTITCIKTNFLNDIDVTAFDVIAIDEAQFFTSLRIFTELVLEMDKHVIIAGLDGDFQQQVFGDVLSLVPIADDIMKLYALCMSCKDGTLAPFSKRLTQDTCQELVGDSQQYTAVCRKCLCT